MGILKYNFGQVFSAEPSYLLGVKSPLPLKDNIDLIHRALQKGLVIPEFGSFCDEIKEIYNICNKNKNGKNASYIPQLARYNPDNFGVSVCTVVFKDYRLKL